MCLKVNLCQWTMLVFTTLFIVLDLSNSQTIRSTSGPDLTTKTRQEITTKIKVTKPATILQLITHGPQKNNKCTVISDFEIKTSNCLKDVYREKWILHIFKYKRENSMFTDLLKQITCSQYKSALQCVHDIWTSCKSEETTAVVQDYLSRQVPLQYNALCDINQHGHHDNTSKQEQHREDKIPTPLTVHFTEKLTYKWETEVTIPETDLKVENNDSEDGKTREEIDKNSKIIHDLRDWSTTIRDLSEQTYFNKANISESLKYVHTQIKDSDKVKFRSTLQYRLRKK